MLPSSKGWSDSASNMVSVTDGSDAGDGRFENVLRGSLVTVSKELGEPPTKSCVSTVGIPANKAGDSAIPSTAKKNSEDKLDSRSKEKQDTRFAYVSTFRKHRANSSGLWSGIAAGLPSLEQTVSSRNRHAVTSEP